jgi:hypothetical protein
LRRSLNLIGKVSCAGLEAFEYFGVPDGTRQRGFRKSFQVRRIPADALEAESRPGAVNPMSHPFQLGDSAHEQMMLAV